MDLDPQGSLTSYLQLNPDLVENTTYDLFEDPNKIIPKATGFDRIKIVGASIALANLEKRASTLQGKGLVVKQWCLKQADDFDFIVIDTPPALGMLMINALAACDQLIVPVQTDFLALKGLERMVKVLAMLDKSGTHINYHIVPTMFDKRTNSSRRSLQVLKNKYEEKLSKEVIPVDTKFREASRLGVPPSFLYAQSHGVQAYKNLVESLLKEAVNL